MVMIPNLVFCVVAGGDPRANTQFDEENREGYGIYCLHSQSRVSHDHGTDWGLSKKIGSGWCLGSQAGNQEYRQSDANDVLFPVSRSKSPTISVFLALRHLPGPSRIHPWCLSDQNADLLRAAFTSNTSLMLVSAPADCRECFCMDSISSGISRSISLSSQFRVSSKQLK
jgi:hypothetical protein